MEQIKMLEVFSETGLFKLSKIFGSENVVYFPKSSIAGVKYDYTTNKLPAIMRKVPFSHSQQFMITPSRFADIILNLTIKGYRPNYTLNHTDIDKEDLNKLNEKISSVRKIPTKESRDLLLQELFKLEDEYDASIESVSFFNKQNRITIKANGILFAPENSLHITDELLKTH